MTEIFLDKNQKSFVARHSLCEHSETDEKDINFLGDLFAKINKLGNKYTLTAAKQLPNSDSKYAKQIANCVKSKEYQYFHQPGLENEHSDAIKIGRETEALKRGMLATYLEKYPEKFTPVELVLLKGSIDLSRETDKIFSEEWIPIIRDSKIGKAFTEMESKEAGSSLKCLPGIPDSIRWFTRELIDPQKSITKENIRLVSYKDSLPTVKDMITTLRDMAEKLTEQKAQGHDDFGYIDYLNAFAVCLEGDNPKTQKQKEDEMFKTWRRVSLNAPVYFVAFAENEYEDPAAVAMVPSMRVGVLDNSERSKRLKDKEAILKNAIIEYCIKHNVTGVENLRKTDTHYRVWSEFAGSDLFFGIASQFLPNDPTIQNSEGAGIFPVLDQQEKSQVTRDNKAEEVFPENILQTLRENRFSLEENAIHEMQAHELNHLPAVTLEAINAIGKTRNLFEEAKATLGGMIAQVREIYSQNMNFQKKALATLLHAAPRYMAIDGNPTYQGYVNCTRIVLAAAEKVNILNIDSKNVWSLDLENEQKMANFWNLIEEFVIWVYSSYEEVTIASPKDRPSVVEKIKNKLNYWVDGQPENGEKYNHTILAILNCRKKG